MGETQICFMDSFPVEFFCFHDNLNSFSFGGTRLPVSGVPGNNTKHSTEQRLKPTATGTGGCSLPRLTRGRKSQRVRVCKVPELSDCAQSWGVPQPGWELSNPIPPAGLAQREVLRPFPRTQDRAPCTPLHRHTLQGLRTRKEMSRICY